MIYIALIVMSVIFGLSYSEDDCIDVTTQLQALVKDSKLHLGAQTEIVSKLIIYYS